MYFFDLIILEKLVVWVGDNKYNICYCDVRMLNYYFLLLIIWLMEFGFKVSMYKINKCKKMFGIVFVKRCNNY